MHNSPNCSKRRRTIQRIVGIGLFALFCSSSLLSYGSELQADSQAQKIVQKKERLVSAYCGLRCLYAAMRFEDVACDFVELVDPNYLGPQDGSSLLQLRRAARDHGLYAEPVQRLGGSTLRACPYPVILHVKTDAESSNYDHYILFLGDKEGSAVLFNPPNPVALEPYYKLASRWDGKGLIVSSGPINLKSVFAPAIKVFALATVLIVVAVLFGRVCINLLPLRLNNTTRCRRLVLAATKGLLLASLALCFALIYHFFNEEGFLAHAEATMPIEKAYLTSFMPKVDAVAVKRLISRKATVVDARYKWDFKEGHIEGAVNIPVGLYRDGRQAALAHVKKDQEIVVYCRSEACSFAEIVARGLASDGFSHISIYKKGWTDWKEKITSEKSSN